MLGPAAAARVPGLARVLAGAFRWKVSRAINLRDHPRRIGLSIATYIHPHTPQARSPTILGLLGLDAAIPTGIRHAGYWSRRPNKVLGNNVSSLWDIGPLSRNHPNWAA